MEYKNRNEVPEEYKWDLTDFFKNEEEFQNSFDKTEKLIDELKIYVGCTKEPSKLYEYLNKYGADKLVNYFEVNKKNVYYWLYELAYNKMIPNDLVSVENFKNEVFEFLRITNQESIHS